MQCEITLIFLRCHAFAVFGGFPRRYLPLRLIDEHVPVDRFAGVCASTFDRHERDHLQGGEIRRHRVRGFHQQTTGSGGRRGCHHLEITEVRRLQDQRLPQRVAQCRSCVKPLQGCAQRLHVLLGKSLRLRLDLRIDYRHAKRATGRGGHDRHAWPRDHVGTGGSKRVLRSKTVLIDHLDHGHWFELVQLCRARSYHLCLLCAAGQPHHRCHGNGPIDPSVHAVPLMI